MLSPDISPTQPLALSVVVINYQVAAGDLYQVLCYPGEAADSSIFITESLAKVTNYLSISLQVTQI